MDGHQSFLYLCLCAAMFRDCSTQEFLFKDQVMFQTSDQAGNWSLTGQVKLSQTDLIMFKPKISVQTCHDVCTIDLTSCSSANQDDEQGCHCERKVGDVHHVSVKSTAKFYQSLAKVTATIPSREMFDPISGSSIIGELPEIRRNMPQATYQIDDGPTKELHRVEDISVCSNTLVSLHICVPEKVSNAVLKINARNGQTLLSSNMCVKMLEVYQFDKFSTHMLTFSYAESKKSPKTVVSSINIKENNNCSEPATTKTPQDGCQRECNSQDQTKNVVSNINNNLVSIQQKFNKLVSSVRLLKEDVTELKDITFCSKGNGCETKPRSNFALRCFRAELENVTWYEAVERCKSMGGILAEIHDLQSLEYFNKVVAPKYVQGDLASYRWLGGTDEGHEGIWKWATSGEDVSVSNWRSGEPSNSGHGENCLHIYGNAGWNDARCDYKSGYICQKDGVSCDGWM